MAQRITELNMLAVLRRYRALPRFDESFRQLELSSQRNTLIAWEVDGTFVEYAWIPLASGPTIVGCRELTREEAEADYAPSNVEETKG
jgi:hypothetical protein